MLLPRVKALNKQLSVLLVSACTHHKSLNKFRCMFVRKKYRTIVENLSLEERSNSRIAQTSGVNNYRIWKADIQAIWVIQIEMICSNFRGRKILKASLQIQRIFFSNYSQTRVLKHWELIETNLRYDDSIMVLKMIWKLL